MGRVPLSSRGQIWRALLTLTLANVGIEGDHSSLSSHILSFFLDERTPSETRTFFRHLLLAHCWPNRCLYIGHVPFFFA